MVFHPIFGGRADNPLSRPARTYAGPPDDVLISYPASWGSALASIPEDGELAPITDVELMERFDLDPHFFTRHVPAALRRWRESPSQSPIGILGQIEASTDAEGRVFKDMSAQTRAIGSLLFIDALLPGDVRSVAKDRKFIRIGGSVASTLDDDGRCRFFKAMLGFVLWERRNRAKCQLGIIKMPKVLFRGLRDRDIHLPNAIPRNDAEPWNFHSCRMHLARRARLLETPLKTVAGTSILSFTATRSIAEYFTGDEGSVVEVEPAAFKVVSSWSLDPALANPDPVTGRQEREWIIRIQPDFVPSAAALSSRDRTYAYSTRDPMGIELLHHHTHARYELEGRRVEASFAYNRSGVGGRVIYRIDDEYAFDTRRTTKAKTGFDPVPGPGRPALGLIYFTKEPWQSRRKNIDFFENTAT